MSLFHDAKGALDVNSEDSVQITTCSGEHFQGKIIFIYETGVLLASLMGYKTFIANSGVETVIKLGK